MPKPARALAKPFKPRVIVLEDHESTAEGMCHLLITNGMICHSVGNIPNLVEAIQNENYDAASVDWDINGTHRGPLALTRLSQFEGPAGKVVYSVFAGLERVKRMAEIKGADYIVEKRLGETEEEYLKAVQNAARLGLARRISDYLAASGEWKQQIIESSSPEEVIDPKVELELFRKARKLTYESMLFRRQKDELMDLLKRRGWWGEFDAHAYSRLRPLQRLATIAQYAGVTAEDLARILTVDDGTARDLLAGEFDTFERASDADKLVSVLAYVLRLARYEPELMSYYWNTQGLFRESSNPPPWDKGGLAQYLKSTGIVGVNDALFWIRRN